MYFGKKKKVRISAWLCTIDFNHILRIQMESGFLIGFESVIFAYNITVFSVKLIFIFLL